MQFLNGGEADINIVGINGFKIICGVDIYTLIFDMNSLPKKIFNAIGVEKIIFGFLDDIGGVNKKEKVSVALLVEI